MTHHVAPPLSTPSAQLPPTAQRITPPRTPAAGATARLVALPQLDGRLPHDPSAVDGYLASMQRARQVQLDALPTRPSCLVATAHRRGVGTPWCGRFPVDLTRQQCGERIQHCHLSGPKRPPLHGVDG